MNDTDRSPNDNFSRLIDSLAGRFNGQVEVFRGETTVQIMPEQIIEVCRLLSESEDFQTLVDETAVDYWPQENPRFHMVYQIRSVTTNQILSLRVPLDGNEPVLPSIVSIYPNADYYERELWDMFGIRFAGHPDLRRILMPHDWVGHPLRKDYPLGYEEPQFTFNYEQVQVRKLNPKE